MNRAASTCCGLRSRKQRGFILLELLLSFLAAGVLLLLLTTTLQRTFFTLTQLEAKLRLAQGRRHVLMQLEKTLAYDVVQFKLEDGHKINCQTLNGNKHLLIYCDKNVLYQKTTTGDGSGINPLSLEETKLTDWCVVPIAADKLRISFTLTSAQQSLKVVQLIYCYNKRED